MTRAWVGVTASVGAVHLGLQRITAHVVFVGHESHHLPAESRPRIPSLAAEKALPRAAERLRSSNGLRNRHGPRVVPVVDSVETDKNAAGGGQSSVRLGVRCVGTVLAGSASREGSKFPL